MSPSILFNVSYLLSVVLSIWLAYKSLCLHFGSLSKLLSARFDSLALVGLLIIIALSFIPLANLMTFGSVYAVLYLETNKVTGESLLRSLRSLWVKPVNKLRGYISGFSDSTSTTGEGLSILIIVEVFVSGVVIIAYSLLSTAWFLLVSAVLLALLLTWLIT